MSFTFLNRMSSVDRMANLRADVPASLVVFLLALPLSIGISVISGVPVRSGLLAALVGGLIVAPLSGAPLTISGPAAGLSVVVLGFGERLGLQTLFLVVSLAGILQIIAGISKVARVALAISPAVLHALLASIGIMVVLSQLHVFLGAAAPGRPVANALGLPHAAMNANMAAVIIGGATLFSAIGWNATMTKRLPYLPGALVAVVVGTLVGLWFPGDAVPHLAVSADVLSLPPIPGMGNNDLRSVLIAAVGLAAVASAESLLCVVATDSMHGQSRSNLDRDLIAKGIGNTILGLLGGLPVLAEIVRSKANITAGAKTWRAGFLHGVWMLLFVVFFRSTLALVPKPALAALLIYVGATLIKLHELKQVVKFGDWFVYAVTMAGILFDDPLVGIGLGFVLALTIQAFRSSTLAVDIETQEQQVNVTVRGALTFLTVPSLSRDLEAVPAKRKVHIDFAINQVDHSGMEAVQGWVLGYTRAGGTVEVEPLEELWRRLRSVNKSHPPKSATKLDNTDR